MPAPPVNPPLIWRTAGGTNARCGVFPREVRLRPRPARRLPAQGSVQASVVFDDQGTAFVADMAGGVQAFDASGKLRWRVMLAGGISATPVVHPSQPRLFVGTHAGEVHALDTATGSGLWRTPVPTRSDPRILPDLLHVPSADLLVLSSWGGSFHALDAASGTSRFAWDAGLAPWAAAAADAAGSIYGLRAVAGRGVEWVRVRVTGEESVLHRVPETPRGARRALVAAAPVLSASGAVAYFVVNQDSGGLLHAWSLRLGSLLWSLPLSRAVQATPALRPDGTILLADLGGSVRAISSEGVPQFEYRTGCEYLLAGGVCEAGGTCFLGDPLGALHAINRRGEGRVLFRGPRSLQARPSFGPDSSLYLPSTDRTVLVFRA